MTSSISEFASRDALEVPERDPAMPQPVRSAVRQTFSLADVAHGGAREALGATHVDSRVVDEGDILTSVGVVAGIDLGLWLVERFIGNAVYGNVETEIEYTRREPIWTRERQVA